MSALSGARKSTNSEMPPWYSKAVFSPSGLRLSSMATSLPHDVHQDKLKRIPLGRFAHPDEVANMVSFLCGPDMTFSTGAVFDLSGGRLTY